MKKIVVVSTTLNDDYLFFLPIITWAWDKFGWAVCCFMENQNEDKGRFVYMKCSELSLSMPLHCLNLPKIHEYSPETISQVARIYAADYFLDNVILMTSDIDILPLSDYWHPKEDVFTTYGRDLTDFHNPICYLSTSAKLWRDVMNIKSGEFTYSIKRDLDSEPFSKSENKEQRWVVDQEIITKKLLERKDVVRIDRGIAPNSHFPLGRIDRGSWDLTLQQSDRIDAHLLRPGYTTDNWNKIMKLIIEVFNPSHKEINYFEEYRNEYLKLL